MDEHTNIETPTEVIEAIEIPVEEVVETTDVEQATDEIVEEAAQEETPKEVVEEATEQTEEVPLITFDGTEDDIAFNEKVTQITDKYEIPEEIQSVISALQAKNQAIETPEIFTQIADYGDVEKITTILDAHNTLYSRREENGQFRPETDKFIESITDTDTKEYLFYDLSQQPSTKYPGITRFEEGMVDSLAIEGDTVNSVLKRYYTAVKATQNDMVLATMDIPSFIPPELYDAYKTLSKDTRETMAYWDGAEEYATERADKLNELRFIQKGIDAEIAEKQREVAVLAEKQAKFVNDIQTTTSTFYSEMRNTVAQKLAKIEFSSDPKLNALLAGQQVTMLTQAFLNDGDGEFARETLKNAGINFDYVKAQDLLAKVQQASEALTVAKTAVDSKGTPLNPVELNKAQSNFKAITQAWLAFADDIVKQEKDLALAGNAKAAEAVAEKIKVAPKARAVPKTIATAATNNEIKPPAHIPYGSQQWDEWWLDQAAKTKAYA